MSRPRRGTPEAATDAIGTRGHMMFLRILMCYWGDIKKACHIPLA